MVMAWRDRGVARRLVAVRDNEVAAAAAGIPIVRTKILAFALSGFMAGYAGVCLTFADQRISVNTFAPAVSMLVISMVVIGGLGSIPGAVLGALYLVGLPAIFGTTPTIQFITSGIGLLAFILYLPGGLAELLSRFGDLVALGWQRLAEGPAPTDPTAGRPAPPADRPADAGRRPHRRAGRRPGRDRVPATGAAGGSRSTTSPSPSAGCAPSTACR